MELINGVEIRDNERVDDLQRGGLRIIQDPDRFCFGMDAVLLSDFAHVLPGRNVLDMCTGTGIVPILMSAKTKAGHFTALEIQPESVEMAMRSVRLNKLTDKIDIIEGDIKNITDFIPKASMDVVTCNPPYMVSEHGLRNDEDYKTIARHEVMCNLEDVIRAAALTLKPKGNFYMIHRPFRLAEIMYLLKEYKLEPKRMRLVYPFIDKEPNMVLIEANRGGKPRLTIERPLIVYDTPGQYTEEIYQIYGWNKQET